MSGITDAVAIVGRLSKLAKSTMTLDLQEQISELRTAVLDAQEEIQRLREERNELQRAAAEREQLHWDGALYWRKLPDGQKEGPFCQRCYDFHGKLIHLQPNPAGFGAEWSCRVCSQAYGQQSGPGPRSVKPHF